jgi:SAM-dependent methyltransferase
MIETPPADPRLYAVLAEAGLAEDLVNPRQHRSCELVERYALEHAIALADGLGLGDLLAEPRTVDDLLAARGFVASFSHALRWLLERLAGAGLVEREGARYVRRALLPAPLLDAVRAAGNETDPAYAPAYALLDEAAAIYPRVARGETSGERALFLRAALWVSYFSNANPYYALNNRITARAAATRLAGSGRVLELGAGLGSATAALLDLHPSLTAYHVTEPVVFFRRRAERTLVAAYPGVPLSVDGLDLNQPWAAQGIGPASQDLVWGVNVFHLAHDLAATLAEARAALAPGGWLVVGEGLRPFPTTPVGAELPFQILESFTAVTLDPETRPTPGFLTAETWRDALVRAGFADVEIVPDAIRLRAIHAAFYAAAICGRRT